MRKPFLCICLIVSAALTLAAPAALAEGQETVPMGWAPREDGIYYALADGTAALGWQTIDGKEYYFKSNGHLALGWTAVDGEVYYFGDDGIAYTGARYVSQSRNMYMFSSEGVLQRGGTVLLQGTEYDIDIHGVITGYVTDVTRMAADVLDEIGWDLRAAFNWSASLPYYNRSLRAPAGEVHSAWYASYGFTNRCGNCYVMAATFYQMARLLGQEVYFVEGGVGSARGTVIDHSWTEMVIDGEVYVFDPDFTNEEGLDGFQIWYDKPGTWWYYGYERVA